MQIVIDITEGHYKTLQAMSNIGLGYYYDAILNGTPLPKGHGDLIDRSKIAFDWWSVHGHTCVGKENIFNMPVIVPADTEGEE